MKHLFDDQVRRPHARLALASMLVASTGMIAVNASAGPAGATVPQALPMYGVVNLGIGADQFVRLNQRGQVAYRNGFFDGRRSHAIVAAGGRTATVRGLSNLGVVVGQIDDGATQTPLGNRAFTWTLAGGMRPLAGPGPAVAIAINDRGQAVGSVQGAAPYTRANRWNPDGTQTRLGPVPATRSEAMALNAAGVAIGTSDAAQDGMHATVWDGNGAATDLGRFGGIESVADFVNASGQVAGRYFTTGGGLGTNLTIGFFWSRAGGAVKILPFDWDNVTMDGLNNLGQVAGNRMFPPGDLTQTTVPFLWCLDTGTRLLPNGGAANARVLALNNSTVMVGWIQKLQMQISTRRAAVWQGMTTPVDLNTRLYRVPAGLLLTSALAVNDDGTIVADSNAGLVLLRPGRSQSPAPVLGPITQTTPGETYAMGGITDFNANFIGGGARTHVASATVDDGCAQQAPSLREVRGEGDVSLRHAFCTPGIFTIKVKVTDAMGNAAEVQRLQYVYDPAILTLMGQSTLSGAAVQPARTAARPLQLTVWAPLAGDGAGKAARKGGGVVSVSGPFAFRADVVQASRNGGPSVQLSGTGSLDGRAGYRFTLDAGVDGDRGGRADSLHLRISHQDAGSGSEVVDYDNAAGHAAASSALARSLARSDGASPAEDGIRLVGGAPAR